MGRGRFEKKANSEKVEEFELGQEPVEEGKKKTNVTRILLIVAIVLLAIVLVLMVLFVGVWTYFRSQTGGETAWETEPGEVIEQTFETDPTEEGDETYQTVDPEHVVWGEVQTMNNQDVINILLIGNDARGDGRARSDTIILVSMNEKTNQIQLTSFMRDLYVQIPGYQADRINSAYNLGGPELLDATLEKNFGIVVDGNVEINFEAFEKAIDILGGVDIEVTYSEANFMNGRYGYWLTEGVNHMDGETALHFARIRKFGNGDYDRTERQRRLITTVVNDLKDSDILDLIGLINEVLPYVYTDLSDSEIMSYVTTALDILSSGSSMGSARIPADDAHYMASIRGMSVLVPDLEMCQEDLKEFIFAEE